MDAAWKLRWKNAGRGAPLSRGDPALATKLLALNKVDNGEITRTLSAQSVTPLTRASRRGGSCALEGQKPGSRSGMPIPAQIQGSLLWPSLTARHLHSSQHQAPTLCGDGLSVPVR